MERRYLRHFNLFGKNGQHALIDAKVLVIGAGGLGCSVLYNLAAAGVGHLGVVDFDRVSESNLNRQFLFDAFSVHKLKVEIAKERIQQFNPSCSVKSYVDRIQNIGSIIADYDLIADCSDNFETKFYLNDCCHVEHKDLVSASITRYAGYIVILRFSSYHFPCYRCFCPSVTETQSSSCEGEGVLGASVMVIAGIQSVQIIQEIVSTSKMKSGSIISYDTQSSKGKISHIVADPRCVVCSDR